MCIPVLVHYAKSTHLAVFDYSLLLIWGVAILASNLFYSPNYAVRQMIFQWGSAYIVGRILGPAAGWEFVTKLVALAGSLVAIWAIIEFTFDWHVFQNFMTTAPEGFWAQIQTRSGISRSEAAFGSPIALAAFLSASVPFIMAVKMPAYIRMGLLLTVVVALATTLTRSGMIAALLGYFLVLVAYDNQKLSGRRALATFGTLTAAIGAPVFWLILSRATDTDSSSEYRVSLWREVPQDIRFLGLGDNVSTKLDGSPAWRNLASIDSTPLSLGINFGWLVVLTLSIWAIIAAVRVALRKGTLAEVAIVAQFPVLAGVALITQYTYVIWFLIGLAVSWRMETNSPNINTADTGRPFVALPNRLSNRSFKPAPAQKVSTLWSVSRRADCA